MPRQRAHSERVYKTKSVFGLQKGHPTVLHIGEPPPSSGAHSISHERSTRPQNPSQVVTNGRFTPQGDRPLPAPRGGWTLGLQPSAAPASAGWGSGAPPPPAAAVSVSVPFFCATLCTYAGLSQCDSRRCDCRSRQVRQSHRVIERSSAVRSYRAALSHMVLFVFCLLPCDTLLFSFFLAHPSYRVRKKFWPSRGKPS